MRKALIYAAVLVVAAATCATSASRQVPKPRSSQTEALKALQDAGDNLTELEKIHANTVALSQKMSAIYSTLDKQIADYLKLAAQSGTAQARLLQATKQMQETQMSFNLQYLQLQSQMQDENRQFTMVSNILKTKHDTVKNSISNIR